MPAGIASNELRGTPVPVPSYNSCILDSYESERKPIAVRNTRAARAIAKQVGVLDIPAEMEEDSSRGAVQRQEVGAQVATYLGTQFAPIGVELGARYDGSSIIASDEAAPTDSIVQYIPTGQPGGRAPHSWLGLGRGNWRFSLRSARQWFYAGTPRPEPDRRRRSGRSR